MTTPSAAPYTSRLLLAAVAVGSLALGAGITYTFARRGVAPAVAAPAAAPAAATDHAQAGHATPVAEATAPGPSRVLISPARQQLQQCRLTTARASNDSNKRALRN